MQKEREDRGCSISLDWDRIMLDLSGMSMFPKVIQSSDNVLQRMRPVSTRRLAICPRLFHHRPDSNSGRIAFH
jgi:hypothetical protein